MTCEEARLLLHALLDGELDAGHAREAEAHVAGCARCSAELSQFRAMRTAMAGASLRFTAPASLRRRIEASIPSSPPAASRAPAPSRRSLLQGFALGSAVSALAASGVFFMVMRSGEDEQVVGDAVSAHLRSLQAGRLTDVPSSDQHTVKPWFNGRVPVAPPVPDLAAQNFTLEGGRLDYIDGRPAAALVYRRRAHVINLFVRPEAGRAGAGDRHETLQGFNVRRWTSQGLQFIAVSDISPPELQEFEAKFRDATGTAT